MCARTRALVPLRSAYAVAAVFCLGAIAYAGPIGLTINATFDPTLTTDEDAAIDAAIANVEANIASPNNITVSIYFNSMNSGLGESVTSAVEPTYLQYYSAYAAVATSADQLEALASLGPAPTSLSPGNPVNGNPDMIITTAEARNLEFDAPGGINSSNSDDLVNGDGTYDGAIGLYTSITSPPNSLSGNYSLQAVATHEIDEVLGIGGTGSTIPAPGNPLTDPVGDLDLYRYSAPGVRSYSNTQTTSPYAYFSIDNGTTALSYFNQTQGADYADWLSNPIPAGYPAQIQDAFGQPGADLTLGPNEIAAFSAIGYEVAPEPSTMALVGFGLLGFGLVRRRQPANR
jgi:hypothetical protein